LRHIEDFGRLAIALPFNRNEQKGGALFGGQHVERAIDHGDFRALFDHGAAIFARQRDDFAHRDVGPAPPIAPAIIDEQVLRDAEQPTVDPGARGELMAARQCALDRRLHELVSITGLAAQALAKSAQSGKCGQHVRTQSSADRLVFRHFDPYNAAGQELFPALAPIHWLLSPSACNRATPIMRDCEWMVMIETMRARSVRIRRGCAAALVLAACGTPAPLCAQEHGPPPMMFDHGPDREAPDRAIPDLPERAEALAALIDRLAMIEQPERDADGYPVRRGQVSALELSPAALARLEARGYRLIGRTPLPTLGQTLVQLAAPKGMTARDAAKAVATEDPAATVDMVHYYGLEPAGGKPHLVRGPVPLAGHGGDGAPRPVIGMIDTTVTAHPALAGARIVAWAGGERPGGPVAHGTAVASIIAASGDPTIYSANIFRGSPSRPFTSADVVAQALEWLLSHDVPVINMSLAGPRNALLDRLIGEAVARGRTIVAAAGNGGPTAPPAYPAALPGVIAVTAVDHDLRVYRFANRGRYVAFAASGVDVMAANAPGGMARFTGTSFATAHVAAILARCRAGGNSAAQCLDRLVKSARDLGPPGRDDIYGYGFVE